MKTLFPTLCNGPIISNQLFCICIILIEILNDPKFWFVNYRYGQSEIANFWSLPWAKSQLKSPFLNKAARRVFLLYQTKLATTLSKKNIYSIKRTNWFDFVKMNQSFVRYSLCWSRHREIFWCSGECWDPKIRVIVFSCVGFNLGPNRIKKHLLMRVLTNARLDWMTTKLDEHIFP